MKVKSLRLFYTLKFVKRARLNPLAGKFWPVNRMFGTPDVQYLTVSYSYTQPWTEYYIWHYQVRESEFYVQTNGGVDSWTECYSIWLHLSWTWSHHIERQWKMTSSSNVPTLRLQCKDYDIFSDAILFIFVPKIHIERFCVSYELLNVNVFTAARSFIKERRPRARPLLPVWHKRRKVRVNPAVVKCEV